MDGARERQLPRAVGGIQGGQYVVPYAFPLPPRVAFHLDRDLESQRITGENLQAPDWVAAGRQGGVQAVQKLWARCCRIRRPHADHDPVLLPVPDQVARAMPMPGYPPGEPLVVGQGYRPVEGADLPGGVHPGLVHGLGLAPAGGGGRVGHLPDPERAARQLDDAIGLDGTALTQSHPVGGDDVLGTCGQPRAVLAVAEAHLGGAVLAEPQRVHAVGRAGAAQVGHQ